MNVYFIDPTYLKVEAISPLFEALEVKKVYSFISKEEMSDNLKEAIADKLVAVYDVNNVKKCADNCAFWLRGHLEKHIRLITEDYEDPRKMPAEEKRNYSSWSAYNNLKNLEDENCLILVKLNSDFDYNGYIGSPDCNYNSQCIYTHITTYCLNILNKKFGSRRHTWQSSFLVFNEFFIASYRYDYHYWHNCPWREYHMQFGNGSLMKFQSFTTWIKRKVHELDPINFPIVEKDGKRVFTTLLTKEGVKLADELIENAQKAEEEQERIAQEHAEFEAMNEEARRDQEQMVRDFWEECGEAASNCDSWPGWG